MHARAEEVEYNFKDELGDLAAKIEELAKEVDEGLQVRVFSAVPACQHAHAGMMTLK